VPRQRSAPKPARSRSFHRAVAVAVALMCLIVAGVVVMVNSLRASRPSVTVTVPGQAAWTPTGADVTAGQHFEIKADGVVHPRSGTSNGPDGQQGGGDNAILPGAGYGALIGRIGSGAPFLVGSDFSTTAESAGELSLGVNDLQSDDNTGSFSAQITY
jgi:hypothetical protein